MQTVHKFLTFLGCAAIVSFCAYGAVMWGKAPATKRPHIVFIVVDDMGWNDVSFHGADQIPTPNIDALAYNGIILNKHYVLPICTPSRTSLMTGRFAIRDGMQGWPLVPGEVRGIPLNVTLMPEYLQRLGYATNLVGKWHVGYASDSYTPARRGFDTFFGYYNGFIGYFDHKITQVNQTGNDLHRDGPEGLHPAYDPKYFTDLITDEAEKIIKNYDNDRPLFLEVSHLGVHATENEETLEVRNMTEVNATFPYIKDMQRRKYAGMMKAVDESVGRVVAALGEAKMLDNSIIIFISDNGAPTVDLYANAGSNYPLRGIKETLFEGGVRGAACIFSPLIKTPSRVSNQLIHIVDWLPTLYAAAGGNPSDIDGPIDGLNQWKTLTRSAPSPRQSLLVNIEDVKKAESAIIGRYKLLKGASNLFEGYYGESGNDPSFPAYRAEEVLSSPAGAAIGRLAKHVSPSARKVMKLREKSTLRCRPAESRANCSTLCLFDLLEDPCETRDLSRQLPEIVKSLEAMIDGYRRYLVPQRKLPTETCSYPRYFNGTWMPWRKADNFTQTVIPPEICQKI